MRVAHKVVKLRTSWSVWSHDVINGFCQILSTVAFGQLEMFLTGCEMVGTGCGVLLENPRWCSFHVPQECINRTQFKKSKTDNLSVATVGY